MTFEETLTRNGYLVYTNIGISMLPLLRENRDYMVIRKRSSERLHKYDAVLYIRPQVSGQNRYVLHRVLKVLNGGYWIVGDNCTSGEFVPEDNIIGVLDSVLRDGREIDFHSFSYRLYICLWCAPYRFRFACLRAKNFIGRCLRFVWLRIRPHRKDIVHRDGEN